MESSVVRIEPRNPPPPINFEVGYIPYNNCQCVFIIMLLPDYAHRKMTAIYVCICTTYMAECLYLPCNSQCSPWQSGPAPYAFLNSCGKPSRHKLRPGHTYPPTLPYFVPGENSGSGHACTPRGGGGGGNSLLRVCTACMMAYSSWY